MKLYYAPLACSLASRITMYELGLEADFVCVDRHTKHLDDGSDYRAVHPLGLVPALETDDGILLTEDHAILRHLASLRPEAGLAPSDPRLDQWLSFIASELHTAIFRPIFRPDTPPEVRAHAIASSAQPLGHVEQHLEGRLTLLEQFSVADIALYVVLSWVPSTPIDLAAYPALEAFRARIAERPAAARAFGEELPVYREWAARTQAATG